MYRVVLKGAGLMLTLMAGVSCKDLTRDPGLPAGTPDPAFYNNAYGAIGLRVAAVYTMDVAIPLYLLDVGLLSDELVTDSALAKSTLNTSNNICTGGSSLCFPLDQRQLPDGGLKVGGLTGLDVYSRLQDVRGTTSVALGALAAYDTAVADRASQQVMRGELFALQGYAELLMAELYCSGVPLSTLDFQHDFTYQASSTAAQVYADARTKLDSALALAVGSDSVLNLARVLKGRAQLELGNYAAAADDVALVPTTFQYRLTIDVERLGSQNFNNDGTGKSLGTVTIADREGENGLPFLSSGDPRVPLTVMCTPPDPNCPADTLTMPAKYFPSGPDGGSVPVYTPFVVASGIEARLIEAEAALHAASPDWRTILNTLRTTATAPGQTVPMSDTISDPGSDSARVSVLFQERAYWLFLTGHRQGDLRRLIRQYGRLEDQVYPTGTFTVPDVGLYGQNVNVPIPQTEYINPKYHGCLDRNA